MVSKSTRSAEKSMNGGGKTRLTRYDYPGDPNSDKNRREHRGDRGTKPTCALIGERGPEAILPLSKLMRPTAPTTEPVAKRSASEWAGLLDGLNPRKRLAGDAGVGTASQTAGRA
jgi:hypothetical protein